MKRICAWCQKVLQEGPEQPVSHGVCDQCARRISDKYRFPYNLAAEKS